MFRKIKEYISRNEKKYKEIYTENTQRSKKYEEIKNGFPFDIRLLAKEATKSENFSLFLINDNYTPMEYVVLVLEECFELNREMAVEKMLEVHTTGESRILISITQHSAEVLVSYLRGHANARGYPLVWKIRNAQPTS